MARGTRLDWILIAGQMKAATTSLHAMLASHPDAVGTWPKETDWWTHRRIDDAAFRRRFAKNAEDRVVVDGSVDATRAKTDFERVRASLRHMSPPRHIVYVLREEAARIRSHALHAFFHERFPRTSRAAQGCVEEALATSDVEARLGPWLDACPDASMHLLRFEDLSQDAAGSAQQILRDIGLADWDPPARHDHKKDSQRPLAGPLRAMPGRDRAVRFGKRLLGRHAHRLLPLVGGRRGVPRTHPYIEDRLAGIGDRIDAVAAANATYLRDLAKESRVTWVRPET